MGMKMSQDSAKDSKFDKSKLEMGEAKIEGDKAVIPVKEVTSGQSLSYTLKKENGKWKVAFDKSSLMGPNMEKMNEEMKKIDSMPSMDTLRDAIDDGLQMDTMRKMNP
jgi:hypothetical protein